MQPVDIIDKLGGEVDLARRLQLSRSTVTMWKRRGIPPERALQLHAIVEADQVPDISLETLLRAAPILTPVAATDLRRIRRGKATATG